MKKTFLKLAAVFPLWIFAMGCATTSPSLPPPRPTRLMPSVPPEKKQTLKAIEGGLVELGMGTDWTVLKANLNNQAVYVHILYSNQGNQPVHFGPESLSLADAGQVLVRSLSPAELVQPYVEQAKFASFQAEVAAENARAADEQAADFNQQKDKEREKRKHDGERQSDLELAADAVGEISVSLTAITANSLAVQAARDAHTARLNLQTFSDRASVGVLQSRDVPPGTKTEGLVYFAEPSQWPATVHIVINGKTLSVQFKPESSGAMPPQVAISSPAFLSGHTRADFRIQAADLRRSVIVDGISMAALPLTPALVEAREKRRGVANASSPQETKDRVQTAVAALQPDKSEFEISLGAYDPQLIEPDRWQATLIDSHLKEYPVALSPMVQSGAPSYISAYSKTRLYGTSEKVDFSEPFQLNLSRDKGFSIQTLSVAWQTVQASTSSVAPRLLTDHRHSGVD